MNLVHKVIYLFFHSANGWLKKRQNTPGNDVKLKQKNDIFSQYAWSNVNISCKWLIAQRNKDPTG